MRNLLGAALGLFTLGLAIAVHSALAMMNDPVFRLVGYCILGLLFAYIGYAAMANHHKIKRLSMTDSLTGIYNRHFLGIEGHRQYSLSLRHGYPLSVMMIDIDNLKKVNDSAGHLSGDALIRSVARCLKMHLRSTDVVARYGGDEFVILLPYTDCEGAEALAWRLREAIRSLGATVSIGLAADATEKETFVEFLSRADYSLYMAKTVKDTVEMYQAERSK